MDTCPAALKDISTLVERWKQNDSALGLSKRLQAHLTSMSMFSCVSFQKHLKVVQKGLKVNFPIWVDLPKSSYKEEREV